MTLKELNEEVSAGGGLVTDGGPQTGSFEPQLKPREKFDNDLIKTMLEGEKGPQAPGEGKGPMKPFGNSEGDMMRMECMNRGYRLFNTVIGEGAYAKVRTGSVLSSKLRECPDLASIVGPNKRKVAVKIFNKRKMPKEFLMRFLPREIDIHINLSPHPNVVRLIEFFANSSTIFMVMELCEKGDLLEFINATIAKQQSGLDLTTARHIFSQICQGLHHIHSHNICHRDLKCENVLIKHDGQVKITDFGFSCQPASAQSLLRTPCGSYAYTAPEVIKRVGYDGFKADIWGLGIILFTMVNGRLPFSDNEVVAMTDQTPIDNLEYCEDLTDSVIALTCKLLQFRADRRPQLDEIIMDPWLNPMDSIRRQAKQASRTEEGQGEGMASDWMNQQDWTMSENKNATAGHSNYHSDHSRHHKTRGCHGDAQTSDSAEWEEATRYGRYLEGGGDGTPEQVEEVANNELCREELEHGGMESPSRQRSRSLSFNRPLGTEATDSGVHGNTTPHANNLEPSSTGRSKEKKKHRRHLRSQNSHRPSTVASLDSQRKRRHHRHEASSTLPLELQEALDPFSGFEQRGLAELTQPRSLTPLMGRQTQSPLGNPLPNRGTLTEGQGHVPLALLLDNQRSPDVASPIQMGSGRVRRKSGRLKPLKGKVKEKVKDMEPWDVLNFSDRQCNGQRRLPPMTERAKAPSDKNGVLFLLRR